MVGQVMRCILYHLVKLLYLCRGEASIGVLLANQPPNNARGIAHICSSRAGTKSSQQHIGADLH